MNHLSKRIDDEKKNFKKLEYENHNVINHIKELETQVATTSKFIKEKEVEFNDIQINTKNLDEEQ